MAFVCKRRWWMLRRATCRNQHRSGSKNISTLRNLSSIFTWTKHRQLSGIDWTSNCFSYWTKCRCQQNLPLSVDQTWADSSIIVRFIMESTSQLARKFFVIYFDLKPKNAQALTSIFRIGDSSVIRCKFFHVASFSSENLFTQHWAAFHKSFSLSSDASKTLLFSFKRLHLQIWPFKRLQKRWKIQLT